MATTAILARILNLSQVAYYDTILYDGNILYLLASVLYFILRFKYGTLSLDHIKPSGPYQVGFKKSKTKSGNFLGIYYPVDQGPTVCQAKSTGWGNQPGPTMYDTL